tara:strand:- start:1256 stop:2869 length:1614 start_codon:yes stop_codon:yes gene_type:complete
MMTRSTPANAKLAVLFIILIFITSSLVSTKSNLSPQDISSRGTYLASSEDVNFTIAGGEGIALSNEPLYLGDSVAASLLVHNKGENSDLVRLIIEDTINSNFFVGEFIEIMPGSSREISSIFSPSSSGNNNFSWSVFSPNGGISNSLNGSFSVEIMNSQHISASFDSYSWDLFSGLKTTISLSLSDGASRDIMINIYDDYDGDGDLIQSLELNLDPGHRMIYFDLSNPNTEKLYMEVIPLSWSMDPSISHNTSQLSIEIPYVNLSISINDYYPLNPSYGENLTINYDVLNSGNSATPSGIIRIIMPDMTIIHEENLPSLASKGAYSGSIKISEWEYSQSVNTSIIWLCDGYYGGDWVLIESSIAVQSEELPFDFYAVLYGSIAGLTIVLLIKVVSGTVLNRTPSTDSNSKIRAPRGPRLSTKSLVKAAKREISCPLCEQRLNIPSSHEGKVKCPSCDSNFEVKPAETIQPFTDDAVKDDPESDSNIDNSQSIVSVSSKEEMLDCPECSQKLRVQLDKRPVHARCPACRTEFMAIHEE